MTPTPDRPAPPTEPEAAPDFEWMVDDVRCFVETYGLKHSISLEAREKLLAAILALQEEWDAAKRVLLEMQTSRTDAEARLTAENARMRAAPTEEEILWLVETLPTSDAVFLSPISIRSVVTRFLARRVEGA